MYLIFDTETSGLKIPNYPLDHPNQARIMQIAAILLDEEFNEVSQFYTLIDIPEITIVNAKAFEAHGISKEKCKKYGIPIDLALINLDALKGKSKYQIGHNISFDLERVHDEECLIFGAPKLLLTNQVCTMNLTTNICKLPNVKYPGKYKWPKLSEAYQYLFKEPFDKAHDSLADVRACGRIFRWLKDNNELPSFNIISPAFA